MPDSSSLERAFSHRTRSPSSNPLIPRGTRTQIVEQFKARIVLLDRRSFCAKRNRAGLPRRAACDFSTKAMSALSRDILSRGEVRADRRFQSRKAYLTRLKWRNASGKEQSKLLLVKEALIEVLGGKDNSVAEKSRR